MVSVCVSVCAFDRASIICILIYKFMNLRQFVG